MQSIGDQLREAAETAALVEPACGSGWEPAHRGLAAAGDRSSLARRLAVGGHVPEIEQAARELGIPVEPFDHLDCLDIAIDAADQVTAGHRAIKGGHGLTCARRSWLPRRSGSW